MSKNYFMPGSEITPEGRESVKKFQKDQENQKKEDAIREVEISKIKKNISLETLLKTRLLPAEDRVIVWPDPVNLMTDSGLYKPQEVVDRERPCIGTVIISGPGKTQENLTQEILCMILESTEKEWVKQTAIDFRSRITSTTSIYTPGTRVLYGRLAGTPVEDPETKEELLIMRPTDIFSRIK